MARFYNKVLQVKPACFVLILKNTLSTSLKATIYNENLLLKPCFGANPISFVHWIEVVVARYFVWELVQSTYTYFPRHVMIIEQTFYSCNTPKLCCVYSPDTFPVFETEEIRWNYSKTFLDYISFLYFPWGRLREEYIIASPLISEDREPILMMKLWKGV